MTAAAKPVDYIDLGRTFRELTDEERADATALAYLHERASSGSIDWETLLQSERVVILAEAGSGKTRELRERCEGLKAQGKAAFFVPIDVLSSETVDGYLAMDGQ